MTGLLRRLHAVLDEFNAAYPWDHNAYYHRWILRQLPPRFGRALDAGSGSGDLARLLAGRADRVCGIDIDPVITARARELTDPAAPVVFTVGDVLTDTPAGPYDVVTCVAAVHHMPLAEALTCFRDLLAPGGTLVVVGLYRAHDPIDVLLDGVSVVLNPLIGWVRHRGRRAPRPVSMTAVTTPAPRIRCLLGYRHLTGSPGRGSVPGDGAGAVGHGPWEQGAGGALPISDGVVSVWRRGSRLPGGAAGVRGRGGLVWRW
jgi:SAM-dependent methyltransferase